MRLPILTIAIAMAAGAAAPAEPIDRRVRAFQVSFPRNWRTFRLDPADKRRLAARALARAGGGKRVMDLAGDGDVETRRASLWALQFSTGFSYDDALRKAWMTVGLRDTVLEVAVAAGPASPAAQRIWRDALTSVEFATLPPDSIARMDPDLVRSRGTLRRAVASDDVATRCAGLRALTIAKATDKEIVSVAISLAQSECSRTRYWAAEYVAKCGLDHPRAFTTLLYAVAQGAGQEAARALLRFPRRASEIEKALLPILAGTSTRKKFASPAEKVWIAHVLYGLGLISDDVVRVLGGAARGHWREHSIPIEPSLSMLRKSPACHEIVLRRRDAILPALGLGADRYGAQFAALVSQPRRSLVVLKALPPELLARKDVKAAVWRHAKSEDAAVAVAARVALWKGQVDRSKLLAWARKNRADAESFLRSIEPASRDAPHELDRELVAILLEPPMLDRLSYFRPFANEIRTAVEPLLSDSRRRFRAARCLAKLGFMSPAISAGLKSRLLHGAPNYAEAAMVACAAAGIDLVDAYIALLPDRRACLWLGLKGRAAERAGSKLVELATHEDCGLEALWALGEIGPRMSQKEQDQIAAIVTGD